MAHGLNDEIDPNIAVIHARFQRVSARSSDAFPRVLALMRRQEFLGTLAGEAAWPVMIVCGRRGKATEQDRCHTVC
jgi:hypothetical protein